VKINWKDRVHNSTFWVFMAILAYQVLSDCGVILNPESWQFYINALMWIAMFFGFVTDTSTPGISDTPKPPTKSTKFRQ
jgi:uncharacterized membrane protein